jgi:hypothetical protein
VTNWTVVLCEGAHDQSALVGVALHCGGWTAIKAAPKSLPPGVAAYYPRPLPDVDTGRIRHARAPDYLQKNGCLLELRALEGDSKVLGDAGLLLTKAMRSAAVKPTAHGIVLDADDKGVDGRTAAVHTKYGDLIPDARLVKPGQVCGDDPRVGLWVMPNNADVGSANALLLRWAALMRPELKSCAETYARSLAMLQGDAEKAAKATLGAIGQADCPAAAVTTALRTGAKNWFGPAVCADDLAIKLCTFLDELSGLAPAPVGSAPP